MTVEAMKSFVRRNLMPTVKMPENTFYELAVFALRYSMGGGTITKEGIIGDIIRVARLDHVAERIANCILRDWDNHLEDLKKFGYSSPSENWARCMAWFKAIKDKSFHRLSLSDHKGLSDTCIAFRWDGRWISASHFMDNQTAVAYVPDNYIEHDEPIYGLPVLTELDTAKATPKIRKHRKAATSKA